MKTVLLALPVLLLCASAAQAAPYVGFDGNVYSITLNQADPQFYPQSAGGVDLLAGERFGRLAAEVSYGTSTTHGNSVTDPMHLTRLTLDGLFYIPVFGGLNFLATAGGARTNYGFSVYSLTTVSSNGQTKTVDSDYTISHGNEFDWRAGGGVSFGLDAFEVRLLARYQPLSMGNQAQNALSLSLGLNYYL